jgi:hypothetical protein
MIRRSWRSTANLILREWRNFPAASRIGCQATHSKPDCSVKEAAALLGVNYFSVCPHRNHIEKTYRKDFAVEELDAILPRQCRHSSVGRAADL